MSAIGDEIITIRYPLSILAPRALELLCAIAMCAGEEGDDGDVFYASILDWTKRERERGAGLAAAWEYTGKRQVIQRELLLIITLLYERMRACGVTREQVQEWSREAIIAARDGRHVATAPFELLGAAVAMLEQTRPIDLDSLDQVYKIMLFFESPAAREAANLAMSGAVTGQACGGERV